ncbi:MAG: lysophospholipid acyltransferase family protein [Oligoflexus sp.]
MGKKATEVSMERFLFVICRLLAWCPVKFLEIMARVLSVLVFDVFRFRRRLILSNLRKAFGNSRSPQDLRRIGRQSVYHFILTAFEFLRGAYIDMTGHIELRGVDKVEAALAKGKGAYIVGFHQGNWEALGAVLSKRICPVHITVKKIGRPDGAVNRLVEEIRRRNGFQAIARKSTGDAYRAMRRALAKQEMVGFVIDQARPGEPRLPFFGHPAKTNTSLAAIWRRVPAPVLTVHIRRVGFGQHIAEFETELPWEATENAELDVLEQSSQVNQLVESIIRRHPEHYFWFHNRWK